MAYDPVEWRLAIGDAQMKLDDAMRLIQVWNLGKATPTGTIEGDARFQFDLTVAQKQALRAAFLEDINHVIAVLQAGL